MTRTLIFFEEPTAANFYPLSLSHPVAALRCGILSLAEKWSLQLEHTEIGLLTRSYLADFLRAKLDWRINDLKNLGSDEAIFINPRFFPEPAVLEQITAATKETAFVCGDYLVAVTLSSAGDRFKRLANEMETSSDTCHEVLSTKATSLPQVEVELDSAGYLWDLVSRNGEQIKKDFALLRGGLDFKNMFARAEVDDDRLIYKLEDVYIGTGSGIDGQVVLDARNGPIYLDENVRIQPHTRVEGPAFIGANCQLVGGKIREGCSFGPQCRIGGEVEESIFQGYINKYHEGFLGHAYVGEWVNFGALTTNSDLKNNYSNIKVELPDGLVDTSLMKVGSFIGDHVKTGIGTLLTTGMVIAFSANLFGGGLAGGRLIPSFVWGGRESFVEYDIDKAIATARVVMSRRGREFGSEDKRLFRYLFEATATERKSFGIGLALA
ncbi:MAG: hypothetical protein KAT58_00480 [candidate division Zixibacteria bacterium]|nr:hypothetical protein [candidate division Zixibacteria bacterium]